MQKVCEDTDWGQDKVINRGLMRFALLTSMTVDTELNMGFEPHVEDDIFLTIEIKRIYILFAGTLGVLMIGLVVLTVPRGCQRYHHCRFKQCQENLMSIDLAKERWAADHDAESGTEVTKSELIAGAHVREGYLKKMPRCPSGGEYSINVIGSDPTCSSGFLGHRLVDVGAAITEFSDP